MTIVDVAGVPTALALVQVPVKPVSVVTVGLVGTVIVLGNATVIVEADVRAPEGELVKPTFHDDTHVAAVVVGAKVTPLTTPPVPVMTGLVPESAVAVASSEVATVKPVFVSVCAPGLVNPVSLTTAAVEFASAQLPPSVTVTVWPEVVAVGEHVPVNPETVVTPIVPVAGTVTAEGNTIDKVDVDVNAPYDDEVKPTFHDVDAPAVRLASVKLTAVTAVAAVKVTPLFWLSAKAASDESANVKPDAA